MTERSPRSAILLPVYPWNPYQRLLAAALTKRGVEARTVETWPRRAPILGAWLANGRPEVVHLHWLHDFLGGSRGVSRRRDVWWLAWQLRLLRWMGVRLVWTVHNLKGHETEDDDRRDALRAREVAAHLAVIERCHAIVLHCEFARAALIERYHPSEAATARMHILPHGNYVSAYDVDADRAVARATLGLEDAGTVFAFIGAIRGYKGVAGLLAAFSASPALGPDARLLICGKPLPKSLGNDLRSLAEADPRIRLRLDRIPEEELSPIIRAADAIVLPFRDILTSGSAILALSHGRPVIAPALGCLPGTLPSDATILYDAESPGALDAALAAASRADLAAMGLRARHYADTLDWDDIAMQTAGLYDGQVQLPAS